ncbi:hypothetical protein HMPREF9946_02223 [Acetobacteraceae bacterium AT-5844]|nr:hypothetical protein HMPREF9946_02223 [Acetobacteraceae bacterium AT-5844]
MAKISLVATKAFRFGGRALVAGDEFEASARDARLLKAVGKAGDPKPKAVRAAKPAPKDDEPGDSEAPDVLRRGRYARRDMQAEG